MGKLSSKLLLVLLVFGLAGAAGADSSNAINEAEFLSDVRIGLGDEPVPVLLRDSTNTECVYKGRAYSYRMGLVFVNWIRRYCAENNNTNQGVFVAMVNTEVATNAATGKRVNKIAKGFPVTLWGPDSISNMSTRMLEEIVVSEVYDAHVRKFLDPTCKGIFLSTAKAEITSEETDLEEDIKTAMRSRIVGRGFYMLSLIELHRRQTDLLSLASRCENIHN